LIVWKNYGLLLSCLKNTIGNGKKQNGVNMNDIFKGLGNSTEGEKGIFNFMSGEDFKNLSAFFESKNISAGETLWKAKDPRSLALLEWKGV
jgi:hypothetical protein